MNDLHWIALFLRLPVATEDLQGINASQKPDCGAAECYEHKKAQGGSDTGAGGLRLVVT